jgi:hypothetical protein
MDMGLLSRLFLKRAEPSLARAEEAFAVSLRALQLDLCADLEHIYSSQMDGEVARTLAAQVVNFLKGEDIDEIARVSDEPLHSRIMAILPQVRQRAAEYMQADRQTREIIVATLRMTTFLNFGKYGEAWFQNPAKMRIERLLVEYGPEFPEEITPAAYEQLSARYHAVKRNRLEYFYLLGPGVPQDFAQAAAWSREAAEQGYAEAQELLRALYHLDRGLPLAYAQEAQDHACAALRCRKAAEQGDAEMQYLIGGSYDYCQGEPQDYAQAAFWYRKAAEHGLVKAQSKLGLLYHNGKGVPQDDSQAALWFRKAAEQGDAGAQSELGILYLLGRGVPQDYAQTALWFRKAAEKGYYPARYGLGLMYVKGQGVPQDYTEAYFWFEVAAVGKWSAPDPKQVAKFRDDTASHLPPADLASVQQRVRKWLEAPHQAKPQ